MYDMYERRRQRQEKKTYKEIQIKQIKIILFDKLTEFKKNVSIGELFVKKLFNKNNNRWSYQYGKN